EWPAGTTLGAPLNCVAGVDATAADAIGAATAAEAEVEPGVPPVRKHSGHSPASDSTSSGRLQRTQEPEPGDGTKHRERRGANRTRITEAPRCCQAFFRSHQPAAPARARRWTLARTRAGQAVSPIT